MKEKPLSEKMFSLYGDEKVVIGNKLCLDIDVKQAVERLKEEIDKFAIHKTGVHRGFIKSKIDKIFGDFSK